MGKFKDIKNFFKAIVQFIGRVIRFIPTILGQIVMWVGIIILAIILIYLIAHIISSFVADILGIKGPGLQETEEYLTISSLTANGYDAVMSSEELQSYYAYEYAVLMDLARNLEETGTYIPKEDDSYKPYDPALITELEWAQLCADTFVTNQNQQYAGTIKGNYQTIKTGAAPALNAGITAANAPGATPSSVSTAIQNALPANFGGLGQQQLANLIASLTNQAIASAENQQASNEMSKEEVIFKRAVSDTTGETSLVPYIVVTRPVTIYSYEFVDHSLSMASSNGTKNYNDPIAGNSVPLFRTGKGGGNNATLNFGVPASMSAGGAINPVTGAPYATSGGTADYIYAYIRPLNYNSSLNANNIAFHKNGAPGSSNQLDIAAPYGEGIWYGEKDDGTVTYEIPLKTLADRFMPKAVLLSSWYMLKQDEEADGVSRETVELILEEIKQIYDKACLEKETEPERNYLLVKDVLATEPQTGNPDKKGLFTRKDFGALTAVEKYASFVKKQGSSQRGTETQLLYERYDTEFDSRVATEISRETIATTPTTPTTPAATPQPSLLQATNQEFTKDLTYDLIDDFNLVVTHHGNSIRTFMNEKQYDKALSDLQRLLNSTPPDLKDLDTLSSSTIQEYILYKTDTDGNYVINCKLLGEEKHHNAKHSTGATHQVKYEHEYGTDECSAYMYSEDKANHDDPYTDDEECFIPQIIISFARVPINNYTRIRTEGSDKIKEKVSVKVTTVTIIDGNIKYLYRVEGVEIEDLAGLTNAVSFMKFDRYDASMTNYSDWDEVNTADDVNDRLYFAVTEVYGAAPITDGGKTVSVWNAQSEIYDKYGERASNFLIKDKDGNELYNKLDNWYNAGIDYDTILSGALNSNNAKIIESGSWAIVRPLNPTTGQYDTIPPTNAAPANGQGYNFPTNCPFQNGESIELTSTYVALKDNDPTKLQALENDIIGLVSAAVKAKIDTHFDNGGTVQYTNTDGDVIFLKRGTLKKTMKINVSIGAPVSLFTVDERITTIKQTVKHKEMPMYLPRHADTWSSVKTMENEFSTTGRFDPEFSDANGGFKQLVPRAVANQGVRDILVKINRSWRIGFYAPHFQKVRESDVLAMIAEWENAGNKGHFAAYTYIRDFYSLIQKAKEVKVPNAQNDEDTYIHKDSYTYMYIPDEILHFDESVTDKAFWLERILATNGDDAIKTEEQVMMRNKRSVKTWQIVDYEKYDECIVKDGNGDPTGVVNVYALWPLGGYLGRSLYAFEANSSASANKKIVTWGAYVGPGVHSGVDFYGRSSASKIYSNAFSNDTAKIKAEYSKDPITGTAKITLTDGSNSVTIGSDRTGTISGYRNVGAYMNGDVPINIDGTKINFKGTTSAVYGYELYRLTKAYEDGQKAEEKLKEMLKTEMTDTPLVAIAPGIVKEVKGGARPGFMVVIEHADGTKSNYLHMKRWPEVMKGEYVGAGTIVGYEGTTGNSGGNHIHHEIHTPEGSARYPNQYLYPFFTPFYYESKVKDEHGNEIVGLESDYLSIVRTVFPKDQIVSYSDEPLRFNKANQDVTLNQAEKNSDGEIILKNYTPTKPLTTADRLHTADEVDEAQVLKKRILDTDKSITSETVYTGDTVIALPQYFDKEFMEEVRKNGGHILKTP